MTGERIVFCVLAIIALCFPMRAKAQALPELPSATVTELHLVNQQAGDLAFNMNGVKLPSGASSILILNGIYKTMQAYNQWAGGEEYLIQQAYYMERQNMPAWLAQYSGDYIFWEIQFFGDHINMITDTSGNLVLNPNGKKALNVMIDENMDQAVKLYKSQNNNSVENLPISHRDIDEQYEISQNNKPYISGKSLHFWVKIDGSPQEIIVQDFSYTYICGACSRSGYCSLPVFTRVYPSGYTGTQDTTYTFISENQVLQSGQKRVTVRTNGSSIGTYNGYMPLIEGNGTFWYQSLSYFLPGFYQRADNNQFGVDTNNYINALGFSGANTDPVFLPFGAQILGLWVTLENGQEVEDNTDRLPIIGQQISADSISTITDAIAEIEPVVDPVTGIEIIEIPQNFPLPENIPLEDVPVPDPVPGGIEDFPQSDPEIAPPYDPSIEPGTTPTQDTLPDSAEEIQPMEELQLVTGLQNRFPFSIPWDIYNAYKMLQAEREIPHWEWEMSVNLPGGQVFTHTFVLDLEVIDPVVGLFRDLFLLAFILGLAIYSYNKFFGGGA